jgi:threonine/homoserine/homoserine lactone efflux protein
MISAQTLLAFLSASFLLAITPGPGIMYVLTRSLAGGRREGLLSSLGTFVGGFAHVLAAGLGLSAVLATSALAYQAVRSAAKDDTEDTAADTAAGNPFTQGIVTEVLNPKTALFFLSFIPQFVNTKGSVFVQFLVLGSISVLMNTTADFLVAFFAGPIGKRLLASPRARTNQRKATGAAMVGLGVFVIARDS